MDEEDEGEILEELLVEIATGSLDAIGSLETVIEERTELEEGTMTSIAGSLEAGAAGRSGAGDLE